MSNIIKLSDQRIAIEDELGKDRADDVNLCHACCAILAQHYPGYLWRVKLEEDTGMMYVINMTLQCELQTHMFYGYIYKLETVYKNPARAMIKAGGEILERASMPRGWWTGDLPDRIDGVKEKHQPMKIKGIY